MDTKHNALVSIVITAYNEEKYLRECLDSVLIQTYDNYEAILVNDCSTDSTGKIADEYAQKDSRFKVVHKQKNEGLNMARASGFRKSLGEYIVFLDGDDMFRADNLEKSLAALHHYNVDFARYQYVFFPSDTEVNQPEPLLITKKRNMYLAQVTWFPEFYRHFPMTVWGGLYNRKLLEEIDWKKSNYRIYEDNFWMLQLLDVAESLVILPEQLYYYRVDNKLHALSRSISGNRFNGKPVGYLELIERLVSEITHYANKYTLDIREEIEDYRRTLYIDRAEKLCSVDGLAIENNGEFLSSAIKSLCEGIQEMKHERDDMRIRIDKATERIRDLETEIAKLNTTPNPTRRLVNNVKRKILSGKRTRQR